MMIKFGLLLKLLRKKQGVSQNQLAEKANTSRQYISRVENNHYNCSLNVLFKYSKALDIPAWKILKLYEKRNSEDGSLREPAMGE